MVTPLVKHKIIKKRTLKFRRYQSDRKVTVKVRGWHRKRGDGGCATAGGAGNQSITEFRCKRELKHLGFGFKREVDLSPLTVSAAARAIQGSGHGAAGMRYISCDTGGGGSARQGLRAWQTDCACAHRDCCCAFFCKTRVKDF
jgi:hypothetical protein